MALSLKRTRCHPDGHDRTRTPLRRGTVQRTAAGLRLNQLGWTPRPRRRHPASNGATGVGAPRSTNQGAQWYRVTRPPPHPAPSPRPPRGTRCHAQLRARTLWRAQRVDEKVWYGNEWVIRVRCLLFTWHWKADGSAEDDCVIGMAGGRLRECVWGRKGDGGNESDGRRNGWNEINAREQSGESCWGTGKEEECSWQLFSLKLWREIYSL